MTGATGRRRPGGDRSMLRIGKKPPLGALKGRDMDCVREPAGRSLLASQLHPQRGLLLRDPGLFQLLQ